MNVLRTLLIFLFAYTVLFGSAEDKASAAQGISLAQTAHLGVIDFFGTVGMDVARVRAALPVREGQEFAMDDMLAMRPKIKDTVQQVTGKPATQVGFVCCDEKGDWMIYVGLSGSNKKDFALNDAPKGTSALPADAVDLYKQTTDLLGEAVKKQQAKEDDSAGYALTEYPPLREKELAIRDYALQHGDLILDVLENSSVAEQRQVAAQFLGYAKQSDKQLQALAHASLDADDIVRNNATRALLVLASNPAIASRIPAENFIAMLCSGEWTDRNKGGALLSSLTTTRDPKLLGEIRAQALPCLIEMAEWQVSGHAYPSRMILGRIAGMDEKRLDQLANHTDQSVTIIKAAEAAK